MKTNGNERGAVLLTTLLLMAVMSALTIAIIDDIRISIRRSSNVQTAQQLDWYGRGAEAFAQNWLKTMNNEKQSVLSQTIRTEEPILFPIDQGGIQIQITDRRNCFNVNQLAETKSSALTRKQFTNLLSLLQFDPHEADTIAASVQDWVDADTVPNTNGAEGFSYANQTPPYHAADALMVDISELREVQGVTEDVYQRLLPYVCAQQDEKINLINVNTLTLDQAPMLALLFGGMEGLEAAQAVIVGRPATGYDNVDQIWELDVVRSLELKGSGKNMARVTTDRLALRIQVKFQNHTRSHLAVFALDGDLGAKLISRRVAY